MYGFKKKAQRFADGGLLGSIFGGEPKKISPEEQAKAQAALEARRTKQGQQSQQGIGGYAGMSAMQRREAVAGLANGGMIRGKGTGTSDSIKAKMPEGTYVMPADTTKKLGLGKPVDVRVSNGEYALPPKAVHAIGAQVLDAVKGATHKPAGFAPQRMHLADGGLLGRIFGGEPKKVSLEQQAAAQAAMEAWRAKQEQQGKQQQGIGGYAGMSKREQQMRDMGLKNGGVVKGYATGGLVEDEKKFMPPSANWQGVQQSVENNPVKYDAPTKPAGFQPRTLQEQARTAELKPDFNRISGESQQRTQEMSAGFQPEGQKKLGIAKSMFPATVAARDYARSRADAAYEQGGATARFGARLRGGVEGLGAVLSDVAVRPLVEGFSEAGKFVGDAYKGATIEPGQAMQDNNSDLNPSKAVATATPAGAVPPQDKPAGFQPETYASRMVADQDAAFAATPATKDVMSNGIVVESRDKNGKANSFSGNKITELADRGNLSVMDTSGLRASPYYQQAVQEMSQPQQAPQNQVITIGENGGFGFDKKDPSQARTEAIQNRVEDLRRAAGIRAATPKMIEAAVAEYGAYDNVANNERNNRTAENRTAADNANNAADRQSRDSQYGVQNLLAANQDARAGVQAGLTNQNLGFEVGAKARLDKAQADVMNAKTPDEQKAAQDRLYALMGKSTADKYISVTGGTAVDKDGNTINLPGKLFNASEGRYVEGGDQQGKNNLSPDGWKSDPRTAQASQIQDPAKREAAMQVIWSDYNKQ